MLILASRSPRRQELLRLLGLPFECRPTYCDEHCTLLHPADHALEIARRKALAAEAVCGPEDIILSSDTVVFCDGAILGKPRDEAEACRMLRTLSGRTHTVCTAVAVRKNGRTYDLCSQTNVTFRDLSEQQILDYVATGEPMDKAGAYGIQGKGALLVEGIQGDYYTVVGLPVCKLAQLFEELSIL